MRLQTSLVALAALANHALTDQDPVNNFCRRWSHRTAIVNNILYIDGGYINWPSDGSSDDMADTNITNTYFLNQPLNAVAKSGMPQLYNNITKPGSAPSTAGGALWPDAPNNKLYFYGGEYTDSDLPSQASLWQYDITHNNWSSVSYQQTLVPKGLAYGASASPPNAGFGYYFGGWRMKSSDGSYNEDVPVASGRLLIYNMDAQTFTNNSSPDDAYGRAEGVMVYLPMSDTGMLVYFGGIIDKWGNGTTVPQEMSEILLYDISNSRWYTQKATGEIPENRRRFCADAAWADDHSSYNIYFYGGAATNDSSPGFDDSYILSIPSFRWIKFYETPNSTFMHHSSSCNMVPSLSQMLVIGGTFPMTSACDAYDKWGTHNMDTGVQNDNNAEWYTYVPTKTVYVVPSVVRSVIGGEGTGGATVRSPEGGFEEQDLQMYVTRVAASVTRTGTASPGHHKDGLSGGAIAGIVIGAVAGVFLIMLVAFLLIRHRHNKIRLKKLTMIPHMNAAAPSPWSLLSGPSSATPTSPHGSPDARYLTGMQQIPVELPTADAYNYQPPQTGPIQLPNGSEGQVVDPRKGPIGNVDGHPALQEDREIPRAAAERLGITGVQTENKSLSRSDGTSPEQ